MVDVSTECFTAASKFENLNATSQPASIFSRARALVEENEISFNPKMHIFNVQGTHDIRVVSLYPKEKCSCPASGLCYHILGVKLSLGAKETGTSNERNLTQLRKNTRPKKDKKSGRKRPRANDIQVEDKAGMLNLYKVYNYYTMYINNMCACFNAHDVIYITLYIGMEDQSADKTADGRIHKGVKKSKISEAEGTCIYVTILDTMMMNYTVYTLEDGIETDGEESTWGIKQKKKFKGVLFALFGHMKLSI